MDSFLLYRDTTSPQTADGSFGDFHDVFAALSEDSSLSHNIQSSVTCESDDDTDVPTPIALRQRKRKHTASIPAGAAAAASTNGVSAPVASSPFPRFASLRHVPRQRATAPWPNVYLLKKVRRFVSDPDSGLDGDHADDEDDEEEDEDCVASSSPYLSPTSSPTRCGFSAAPAADDDSGLLEPYLKIIEQPESHYRARYACEGCRGPMKARSAESTNENIFPTVQIVNYIGSATVQVYLVTTSGEPHYHVLVPGSSRTSGCKPTLVDGMPALELTLNGEEMENMTATLDNVSIRRLRRWEGDRKLKNRGVDPATFKKDRVQAALMFQARIFTQDGVRVLKCQSEPFQCTAPKGSPEISWVSHDSGPASGGNEIGLIGSRFIKGCKVRFYNDNWEAYASIDRAKSNQGGTVVEVPPFQNVNITQPEKVCIEIHIGPGKNPQLSDPVEYTYIPEKNPDEDCASGQCATCRELAPFINMFAANGSGNSPSIADCHAELNDLLLPERSMPEPKRKLSGFVNFMAACPPPAEVVSLLNQPASPRTAAAAAAVAAAEAVNPPAPPPSPFDQNEVQITQQAPAQKLDESLSPPAATDVVLCSSSELPFSEKSLDMLLLGESSAGGGGGASDQVRLVMTSPSADLNSLPLDNSYQTSFTQPENGTALSQSLLSGQADNTPTGSMQQLF